MVIFGLMARSYGNNNLVVRFLFIWLSGFGLMSPSPAKLWEILNFDRNVQCNAKDGPVLQLEYLGDLFCN